MEKYGKYNVNTLIDTSDGNRLIIDNNKEYSAERFTSYTHSRITKLQKGDALFIIIQKK
jgi:hypothetical protein